MPFDLKRYPKNWNAIRAQILERAGNKCEKCGVPNYAVGSRDERGEFSPTAGNVTHDAAGNGELSYKEARELADHASEWCDEKLIVIVLTIAHVDDDDPANCEPSNLAAWCQRCHLRHDIDLHARNAASTRAAKRAGASQLELIKA